MRYLLLCLCLLATTLPAPAQRDRIETAWKVKTENTARKDTSIISVSFKSGANVRFHAAGDKITLLSFQSGKVKYIVPEKISSRLRHVRYASTSISWNSQAKSPAQAKYVSLEFLMGTEKNRKFGELPRVHLIFEKGRFSHASVSRKTSPHSWDSFDL